MQETEESRLHNLKVNDWLECLQNYYLKVDGPYGNTKLTSLDVTPAGLAEAVGVEGCADEVILKAFMSLFKRNSVQKVFGNKIHEHSGSYAYSNFHFLVLSCVVAATTTNAGDYKQYRERLGALLNDSKGVEHKVEGINSLWKALAIWLKKQQCEYRELVLPDPGNWTLIGYAVKLAYPSRKDRADLKKMLRDLPDQALNNQKTLLNYLRRCADRLPERMRDDLADLIQCYNHNQPVQTHHFWRLIETILTEISREKPRSFTLLWSISTSFSGWESNELDQVFISKGNRRSDLEKPFWYGNFGQLLRTSESEIPPQIKKLLDTGCLILCESYNGVWMQDDRSPRNDATALILSSSEKIVSTFKRPLKLGRKHKWYCSEAMPLSSALNITGGKGISESNHRNNDLRIDGGISLGRGYWLSRPGFLPKIYIQPHTTMSISPQLQYKINGGIAEIIEPLPEGEWRIEQKLKNNSSNFKWLRFSRNAPFIKKWPERSERYEAAIEITYEEGSSLNNISKDSSADFPNRLSDALEAIYARAGAPRSEIEIISILKTVLPASPKLKYMVWDVIRSLEEAGWIEQDIKRSWRGRVWRVLPPRLIVAGENIARVEGAIATAEFNLLKSEADKNGINVYVNSASPFAAPVITVTGENLKHLADSLDWSYEIGRVPIVKKAPLCWPLEIRTDLGRKRAGVWKASAGLFVNEITQQNNEPVLYRLVREDDRDVFLIKDKTSTFISTQRVVALLEYARRTDTPLFVYRNGHLERQGISGHLPLPIAQWLRRSTGIQSGPYLLSEQSYSYHYGVDEKQLKDLEEIFDGAITGGKRSRSNNREMKIANDRHRGIRLSYFK